MNQSVKQLLKWMPVTLGVIFVVWLVVINALSLDDQKDLLTDSYLIIPITGGLIGLTLARHWGGMKSYMGKSFIFFSLALLLEGLGLLIYSLYFRINGEELAYPSIGDFVFTLGIVSSSIGSWWMLKVVAPVKGQILKPLWQLLAVGLALSFVFYFVWHGFLYEGIIDDSGNLAVMFNILYPVTQLIYLALCSLALLKVKKTSGGRLFLPVLSLLVAMIILYVADYIFLKQAFEETWEAAGLSDLMYIIAYTAITFALVYMDAVRRELTSLGVTNGDA